MGFFNKNSAREGPYKQVILLRMDLKLPKGKAAAQVAHGSVEAVLNSSDETVSRWRAEGMKKVVLKVADERELLEYQQKAKREGLVASIITDAGKTVVAPGTRTVLAIGPGPEELIDALTGHLGLL